MDKKIIGVDKLLEKYGMSPQEEGGLVVSKDYEHEGEGRAASGHAHYYFMPHTPTSFHIINCDEYWIYHAGNDLETWTISPNGELKIQKLGISDDAELSVFFKKGSAFASRPASESDEGTFVSLVTVPRYSDEGLRLLSEEEVIELCPDAKEFFK